MKPRRPPNRLLGFGPVGWIAAVIFLAIALAAFAGYDFQYHYVYLMGAISGGHDLMWYMVIVHIPLGLSFLMPQFNLISLAYVLPALFIAGTPPRWWQYVLLIVWTAFRQTWCWTYLMTPLTTALSVPPGPSLASTGLSMSIMEAVACLVTALLMWVATRSWRVALGIVIVAMSFAAITAALESNGLLANPQIEMLRLLAWHVALAAIVWTWAVRSRRRVHPEHACAVCGYDLRSSVASKCPECGAASALTT